MCTVQYSTVLGNGLYEISGRSQYGGEIHALSHVGNDRNKKVTRLYSIIRRPRYSLLKTTIFGAGPYWISRILHEKRHACVGLCQAVLERLVTSVVLLDCTFIA